MAPRKWDAYRAFNIFGRECNESTCMGRTKYGKRCRWDIAPERFDGIRSILDQIEAKPPKDAVPHLQRLARLSLCDDYHQGQQSVLVNGWKSALEDAAKEYEKGEGLRSRNKALEKELKQEREMRLKLAFELEELENDVLEDTDAATALSLDHAKIKKTNQKLSTQVEELLAQTRSELSNKLNLEREAFSEYKTKTKAKAISQSRIINELRSKLEDQCDLSAKRLNELDAEAARHVSTIECMEELAADLSANRKEERKLADKLEETTKERVLLVDRVKSLGEEITTERQTSNKLENDLNQMKSSKAAMSAQLEDLRLQQAVDVKTAEDLKEQLSAERQRADQLKTNLAQIQAKHDTVVRKSEDLRSQLAIEVEKSEKLQHEHITMQAELARSHTQLEQAQRDIDNIQKEDEKYKISIAARDEESSAEKARMMDRIKELEKQLSESILQMLFGRLKRTMRGFWESIRGAVWRRRVGVEDVV